MIVRTVVTIDGEQYLRTQSDKGYQIERDGELYDEALDPINTTREYTESDVLIESEEEATEADYQSALKEFGVKV